MGSSLVAPLSGRPSPGLRPVVLTVAVWGGVVSVFVAQRLVGAWAGGHAGRLLDLALVEIAYWIPWLLLTPVLLALVRRFPVTAKQPVRSVLVHLGAGLAVAAIEAPASALTELFVTRRILHAPAGPATLLEATVAVYGVVALWKYGVFVAVASGVAAARRSRERELHAARLESQLTAARLQALEARLHPHFLFNVLHSASMLTLVDPEGANRLLARLADLLRHTLRRGPAADGTLADELELVGRYLDVERIRFPDRLRVEVAVEPEARQARVPTLLLQPLVENAIRHGIAPVSSAGRLTIRGRRSGGDLVVEIEDDGPGPPEDWRLGANGGLGMTATAARLALLYPDAHRLELATGPAGGCRATVTLPYRGS
jgi:two-component system, LytTR family, sensor kinase